LDCALQAFSAFPRQCAGYFCLWLVCTSPVAADIRQQDDLGREVILEKPATRIISLAPHLTETIFAAGAGDRLVGTVSYSDFPEAAKAGPRVGSYDTVSFETVLAMEPDLVFAWASGGGGETIARLEELGLMVYAEDPRKLDDVARSLRAVGQLTGNVEQAERSAVRFEDTLARLRTEYSERTVLTVYYQIWDEPLLTLNGEHIISDVVRLCGGRNVFAHAIPLVSRISVEAVLDVDPQVIVASGMDEARPEWLDRWRQWRALSAVSNGQLYFVPPDLLQRHTPRIVQGAEMLCEQMDKARRHYALTRP